MRLTSYNIALVRLKAGCCLSDMVGRMWQYMEEGDTENAQCVREKALILSGLIKTLCRWRPTIAEGKRLSVSATITSGTFPIPFISSGTFIDGIRISDPFTVFSGGNPEVLSELSDATNGYMSPDDDLVIVEHFSVTADSIHAILMLDNSIDPSQFDADWLGGVTWSVTPAVEDGITNTPDCLTDSRVLSIIKKIDELCGCNC